MNILQVIYEGEGLPSPISTASVYGKNLPVKPFIGLKEYADGFLEPVVGAKCPHQERMLLQRVYSNDPVHYLRAFKMLGGIQVITDDLVKDCITATRDANWTYNLSETNVFKKNGGIYRLEMFREAQKEALAFKPPYKLLQKVIEGFNKHGFFLVKKELAEPTEDTVPYSCTVIHSAQVRNPANNGFYAPLTQQRPQFA